MRTCLLVSVLGIFGLCLTCGLLGSFVALPKLKVAVSESRDLWAEAMADSLTQSVNAAIAAGALQGDRLVLQETDLDLLYSQFSYQPGMPTPPGGVVSSFIIDVTPTGLTLPMGGPEWSYSGVPIVAGGRIDLVQITAVKPTGFVDWFMPAESFERIIENGLNDALAAHGLLPVSIALSDGSLTIVTTSVRGPATPMATPVVRLSLDRVKPF